MSFIPKPHEIYKHFKGNLYQITAIAEHTETGETLVIYQAMYGDFKTYARPLSMFVSPVDREKYPEVAQEFRFELQGPEAARQRAELGTGVTAPKTTFSASDFEQHDFLSQTIQRSESYSSAAAPKADSCQTADFGERVSPSRPAEQIISDRNISTPEVDAEAGEELNLDPMVLEFLDSDSYEQRLNILAGLHHRITDDMITTMAIACDVEIEDGDIEERYESLKACLLTLERYECNRLR